MITQINALFFNFMPEIVLATGVVVLLVYNVLETKLQSGSRLNNNTLYLGQAVLGSTIVVLHLYRNLILSLGETNANLATTLMDSQQFTHPLLGGGAHTFLHSFIWEMKLWLLVAGFVYISLTHTNLTHFASYINNDRSRSVPPSEFITLVLIAILGMLLLISAQDLLFFYLSLELISLTLYILASINRTGQFSTEAGLKYFILGAMGSGWLLMGCGLIYLASGSFTYEGIADWSLACQEMGGEPATSFGLGFIGALFMIVALFFKSASAPFHMWAPDVYEGAPTIVTTFFATLPKFAFVLALCIFMFQTFVGIASSLSFFFFISALLSVLVGSISALNQTKIKRLLAFSAIGHMGFILLGIGTGTQYSLMATLVYLLVYLIMSFNSFVIVLSFFDSPRNIKLSGSPSSLTHSGEQVATNVEKNSFIAELTGLSRINPVLAVTFALTLLSLAGIPPLAGFLSKYLILLAAVNNHLVLLSLVIILVSVISAFYYLRIVQSMFFKDSLDFSFFSLFANLTLLGAKVGPKQTVSGLTGISQIHAIVLGFTTYLIVSLLFYPGPMIGYIQDLVPLLLS